MESQEYIIIENEYDQQIYKVNKKMKEFCGLFVNQFSYQNVFRIPKSIKITKQQLELIINFMEMHSYDIQKVKIIKKSHKINQQQSQVEQEHNNKTQQFIENYLVKLDNTQIKQLIKICDFVQMISLKRVICHYLLRKYNPGYSNQAIREHLTQYQVNKISKASLQQLKIKYKNFFEHFAKKLLEQ